MAKKKAPKVAEEKFGLKGALPAHEKSEPKAKEEAEDKWQMEDDARTLMRHGEIMQDSKRHGRAMKHLSGQKEAITSVEQLKKIHQDMVKADTSAPPMAFAGTSLKLKKASKKA